MGIYLESGFLNQRFIEFQAEKAGCWFIVQIGGRQVGKTYGTLKHMLEEKRHFILMRRTQTEADFIASNINSPFSALPFPVTVKKDTKYTAGIYRLNENEEDEHTGEVMALSTVSKIRGFNGAEYTDLVYDEFIPEQHVSRIHAEGDAFLNAIVTISGNRELEEKPPLRVWLLANANNIASPILQVLGIQNKVESMIATGKEYSIMPDRGIMIVCPHSDQIMAKRKKTALFKAIGTDSNFSGMALENRFSYNDDSDIRPLPPLNSIRLIVTCGMIGVYQLKSTGDLYVSYHISGTPKKAYANTEKDEARCRREIPGLRSAYMTGHMFFESLTVKSKIMPYITG